MRTSRGITGTLEDYLEAIFSLEREQRPARVRDIAESLCVHKSTVSAMLKSLAEKNLVNYSPYEVATLTARGRRIAREVTERHAILKTFLSDVLLIDKEVAGANACRMEHVVDRAVMDRLVLFARFVKECPRAGDDWLQGFADFVGRGGRLCSNPDRARRFARTFINKVDSGQISRASKARRKQAGRGGTAGKAKPGK